LDAETVYVCFRGYKGLGENARRLFQFLRENPAKRLVIDLRQNGGGDFLEGRKHLVRPVKGLAGINQKGRLCVIIGRRTFSAAMAKPLIFARRRMPSSWASPSASGPTVSRKMTK